MFGGPEQEALISLWERNQEIAAYNVSGQKGHRAFAPSAFVYIRRVSPGQGMGVLFGILRPQHIDDPSEPGGRFLEN